MLTDFYNFSPTDFAVNFWKYDNYRQHFAQRKASVFTRCLHEAIVAAIGRATDRRDDRLV